MNESKRARRIREALENRLRESAEYSAARERQLRALREGLDLGTKGALRISKEEMHNRK